MPRGICGCPSRKGNSAVGMAKLTTAFDRRATLVVALCIEKILPCVGLVHFVSFGIFWAKAVVWATVSLEGNRKGCPYIVA